MLDRCLRFLSLRLSREHPTSGPVHRLAANVIRVLSLASISLLPAQAGGESAPAPVLRGKARVERAIRTATGLADIQVWPHLGDVNAGWRKGAWVGFGNRLIQDLGDDQFGISDPALFRSFKGKPWPWVMTWAQIVRDKDTTGDVWIEVRKPEVFVLRRGARAWTPLGPFDGTHVNWSEVWDLNWQGTSGAVETRPGIDGGLSYRSVDRARLAHWGWGKSNAGDVSDIEGIMVRVQARRDPRSAHGKVGLSIGADPYPVDGAIREFGETSGPAICGSALLAVGEQWKEFTAATLPVQAQPPGSPENPTGRTMSLKRFRKVRLP